MCAAASALAELAVPLSTVEPVGVARSGEPVSGGIPLPWNTYRQDQAFAVFAGSKEVPAQVLPLVVDEKGYLRWVLVDLQADVPARGAARWELRAVKGSAAPIAALKIADGADAVTVDTGSITFSVARNKPFGLFSAVAAGGRPVITGGAVSYTDAWSGTKYAADKPTSVVVEYAGPMRTTICAKGPFVGDDKTRLRYIARVTAWAGKSRVHVKYKLSNSNPDHYCYRQIKDSSIALQLAAGSTGSLLGGSKPITAGSSASLTAGLLSRGAGAARAVDGKKEAWRSKGKGDVAQGWIAARLGSSLVYACDAYFTDDPPRRLALDKDTLTLSGATTRFDGGGRAAPFAAKHRVLFDCSHLSSQYLLDFSAPDDAAALDAVARGARGWLHLRADAEWYAETEGLGIGRFGSRSDEFACYDKWGWKYDKSRAPNGPGKIGSRRFVLYEDNHFETEQDSVEGFLLMYLRTGYRSYFEGGQGWANYEMDRQKWRTDGWRWKDGGVWKRSGPLGNKPQRGKDPVTGQRNYCPGNKCKVLEPGAGGDMYKMSIGSQCRCHNYGAGITAWYCLTGDRDALETAIDCVEQMIDYQKRVRKLAPGKGGGFSRDFTRSVYLTNAARVAAPTDPFVIEASDFLSRVYLQRPVREPRGLVNGARPLKMKGFGAFGGLKKFVGDKGLARMKELGVTFSQQDGQLHDPKTGVKWYPIQKPNSFMLPSIVGGIHTYYRVTGDEDAQDWVIAFGYGLGLVLWQRHGQQHPSLLVDFPRKGIVRDIASWSLPDDNVNGKGFKISGYLARFYPDVPARAYELCGDPQLKKISYDYWNHGSHRGYWATETRGLGKSVGQWVNIVGPHAETVCFTAHTFFVHAHPHADEQPPAAVKDLEVTLKGKTATVRFRAPADQGGRVVRYQVKCSDKPLVEYEKYLALYNSARDEEKAYCNWWMAANLTGEPVPGRTGKTETFTVSGVPEGARYFAVRSFDNSSNRSPISNVYQVR